MLIKIGYDIQIALHAPTVLLGALFVRPDRARDLLHPELLKVDPPMQVGIYHDSFGNRCARIDVPPECSTIRLLNENYIWDMGEPDPVHGALGQHALHELPSDTMQYLLPSRYCEVDGPLMQLAWNTFGSTAPGWPRVQAIVDYVHRHLRFDYGLARPTRTAQQAWAEGTGVCRDFAHLALCLCRCMNIPARYVTGYLGDIGIAANPAPMDFSAWFEVYLDGRWHTFDARHNTPRIGRVVMAQGRDAADVPITMVFGNHQLLRFQVVAEEVSSAESHQLPTGHTMAVCA